MTITLIIQKQKISTLEYEQLGIKANIPTLASLLPKQIKEVYKNHELRKKHIIIMINCLTI